MSSLPYPLPNGWQLSSARPPHPVRVGVLALLAVGLAALAVSALLDGNAVAATLLTVPLGVLGLAIGVLYDTSGDERGVSDMINAVVLEKALVPPPDSWTHFFREAGPGRWLTGWFAAVGVIATAVLVWAGALVLGAGSASPWFLLMIVPLLLAALVALLAGGIAIVLRRRHASFGRRPIGISVGPTGVVRYYLDGVDLFLWGEIRDVRASVAAVDPHTKDFVAGLEIVTATPTSFTISGYRAHPWLIYTAVRFWRDHPGAREKLGTTFAQRRIERWRESMAALAGPRRDVGTPR